jgi:hypothetical protein
VPNHLDWDSDGDGIKDVVEAGGTDANNDGKRDGCTPVTSNGSCVNGNLTPSDSDNDGFYDMYDTDSDGDGILDSVEGTCRPIATTPGCNTGDADGDGLTNGVECPNPSACTDTDADGTPNYNDTDSDGDGTADSAEGGAANAVNPCVPSTTPPACTTGDADGDGITNGSECSNPTACGDTDGDGTPNYLDSDSDNDGTADSAETGGPGASNPCLPSTTSVYCPTGDADGDGVINSTECHTPLTGCPDSDGDGTQDYQDTDSDNDGTLDGPDSARTNPCLPSSADAYCSSGDADSDGVTNRPARVLTQTVTEPLTIKTRTRTVTVRRT